METSAPVSFARRLGLAQVTQQCLDVCLNLVAVEPHLTNTAVDDPGFVGAELNLSGLSIVHRGDHIRGNRPRLGIRHQTTGA